MPTRSTAELHADGAPMVPAPFRVLERRQETADTWTLCVGATDGSARAFAPGQFTMLSRGAAGEVPVSISGDPARPDLLVHTVRAVGAATAAICAAPTGSVLGVRGPFGRPWPVEDLADADVVVGAGGIGLAPLRPAILARLACARDGATTTLLYGGRSPDQLLYAQELTTWAAGGVRVEVTVDTAGHDWHGRVGVVPRLVRGLRLDPSRTAALLCGPEIMMRFMAAALVDRGVPGERIFVSAERTMACGVGRCGHCQLGPTLICRDGPVYRWSELEPWLGVREL